jgi:hypothetical protein
VRMRRLRSGDGPKADDRPSFAPPASAEVLTSRPSPPNGAA